MSIFTRRAYIKVAKALRDSTMPIKAREQAVVALVPMFKEDNPLFDVKAFRSMANLFDYVDPKVGYLFKDKENEEV